MRNILILSLLTVLITGMAFAEKIKVRKVQVGGQSIVFLSDESLSYYDGSKKLSMGTLAHDTVIAVQGTEYTFKARTMLYFYESGGVSSGFLKKPARWKDFELSPAAPVSFYESGTLLEAGLSADADYNGFKLSACRDDGYPLVRFYDTGTLYSAALAKDVNKNGVILKATGTNTFDISFYDSGEIQSGIAGPKSSYNGIRIKENTLVTFYQSGKLYSAWLAQDSTLNGRKYTAMGKSDMPDLYLYESGDVQAGFTAEPVAAGKMKLAARSYTAFYDDGKPETGVLAADTVYGLFTLKGGRNISFYNDGSVYRAYLAKDTVYNGVPLHAQGEEYYSDVGFSSDGQLIWGRLSKPYQYGGVTLKGKTEVQFYVNGKIKAGYLDKPLKYQGVPLNAPEEAYSYTAGFTSSGTLMYAYLETEYSYRGIKLAAAEEIDFFSSGEIRGGTLSERTEYGPFVFEEGKWVDFYKNGAVLGGLLAEFADVKLNGKKFALAPGQEVVLNSDKTVLALKFNEYKTLMVNGRETEVSDYYYVLFSDYAKGIVDALGEFESDFTLNGAAYVFNDKDFTFFRYADFEGGTVKAFMRPNDCQVVTAGKSQAVKAFTWYIVDPKGVLKSN